MNRYKNKDTSVYALELAAIRLQNRREHSARELTIKLLQRGFAESDITTVLNAMQDKGWQSDARFVESYVNSRYNRGYGLIRISAELQQKGTAQGYLNAVLDEGEFDWFESAHNVYMRRFSTPAKDPKEAQKRLRFMLQRGFSMEQVKPLLTLPEDDYNCW